MTSIESSPLQSRVIAPKLHRLGNHPWGWVALGDLKEIFNQDETSIWAHYYTDAKAAALAADWDGKPWKCAVPSGQTHRITDVWNMKTGELCQIPENAVANILVPAGWSKAKVKATDSLESAVRLVFTTINNRVCGDRTPIWFVDKAASEAAVKLTPSMEEALQSVGTFSNLELALSQIESAPNSLKVSRKNDDSKSAIEVIFQGEVYGLQVQLDLRLVLGVPKLIKLRAYLPRC